MFICKKCGNIYTTTIKACKNCNSSDFISTDCYDLQKYKCTHCNSIYRMPVKECNNCGSTDIQSFKDGRQIVHQAQYYVPRDDYSSLNVLDLENQISGMSKIINTLVLVILIPASFVIGFSAYMDNNSYNFAPVLPVLIWLLIWAIWGINKNMTKTTGVKIAIGALAISALAFLIILFTEFSANCFKMLFGTLLFVILLEVPIIIKKINVKNTINSLNQKIASLQKNGLLYKNLEYDAIEDSKDSYYIQVKYSTRLDGNENVIMSKRPFPASQLKERVNLLVDTTNLNNYYIYF